VHLQQNYKSFDNGWQGTFEGRIIVLSGINGSGKSQLLDITQGYPFQQPTAPISSLIELDGVQVGAGDVLFRSFRENVSIPELTQASAQVLATTRQQVHQNYQQYRLNGDNAQLRPYRRSALAATDLLVTAYGQEQFDAGGLTPAQIDAVVRSDFIWAQDDAFSNAVGEIFFDYCVRRNALDALAGREGRAADYGELEDEPWRILNDLFADLDFDYRFKSGYWIDGVDINEQPAIFAADVAGIANPSAPRRLAELSDGEKAIISLCFASLSKVTERNAKILLLDEYDATLNPSLAERFFRVLDRFFVQRGVLVVLVTHSVTTVALAPETASFYEVFRPGSAERVLRVDRENYSELRQVTSAYYAEVKDQDARVIELQAQNLELRGLADRLTIEVSGLTRPMVITEGPTDVLHLETALSELGFLESLDINFFDQSPVERRLGSAALHRRLEELASVPQAKRIIGVFDRDEKEYVAKIGDLRDYGNNVFGFCIPVPPGRDAYENISIEFYYADEVLCRDHEGRRLYFSNEIARTPGRGGTKAVVTVIPPIAELEAGKVLFDEDVASIKNASGEQVAHSKMAFARLMSESEAFRTGVDFTSFRLIAEQIKEVLAI
jgi:ABC-type molybdenum transport system ATPase subunit/photorepair protein PhrA